MQGSLLGTGLSCTFFLSYLICGFLLSRKLFYKETCLVQATLGLSLSLLLLMWLPALCAIFFKFTPFAHLTSLILLFFLTFSVLFLLRKRKQPSVPSSMRLIPYALCVGLAMLISAYLLHTHIILQNENGAFITGQSCYGDMCMHLGFISSLATQQFFPPQYSIQIGTAVGYPFLCDSVSASLYQLGSSLRLSYILPMLPALFVVFSSFYLLAYRYLKSDAACVIAFLLFFVGGGLGLTYFLDGLRTDPGNFTRIFTAFYETPMNNVTKNVLWVNIICDMLLPQRATLFGWSLLFPALYLLYAAFEEEETVYFYPLGLWAGAMPLVHTHSFLALFAISVPLCLSFFIRKRQIFIKTLLLVLPYPVLACVLALPQLILFTLPQAAGEQFVRLGFNWVNRDDAYLWFYIKNCGLPLFFLVPAFLSMKKERRFALCTLPLWAVCEFLIFQPNPYDNNKLLFVCWMILCMLVAKCMCSLYFSCKEKGLRLAFAVPILFFCLLGGVLTLGREAVSEYEVFSKEDVKAAEYIIQNTEPDAIFLTNDNHNNTVAALTGRNIVIGSPSYLYYHGVYDEERYEEQQAMLTQYGALALYKEKYRISYVYISNTERANGADEALFSDYPIFYQNESVTIFKVA